LHLAKVESQALLPAQKQFPDGETEMRNDTPISQELYRTTTPALHFGQFVIQCLVEKISDLLISNNKLKATPTVRRNLSLITQLPENNPQIEVWTNKLCQNVIFSYVELFLDLIKGPQHLNKKIEVDLKGLEQIRHELACGHGVVLAGTHTCGFDHAVQGLKHYLPGIQVLSKANPTGRNRFMYFLRKIHKIDVTPISLSALREAIKRLRSGGVAAVAIDLPVPNGEQFTFFDQNCLLTNAHTRMAEKSGAKVFLVYTRRTSSGVYQIKFQEVKQPSSCYSTKNLINSWAQKSYIQLERFILQWPDAWYGTSFDLFSKADAIA
jgi:lauroyl/myristoyl acyltransferase